MQLAVVQTVPFTSTFLSEWALIGVIRIGWNGSRTKKKKKKKSVEKRSVKPDAKT